MFLPSRPLFASFQTGHRSARHWLGVIGGLAVMGVLAGCHREEARTYTVSKESTAALPPHHPPVDASPHSTPDRTRQPGVTWTLPEGWTELPPNQFRVGNFRITGADGAAAEVSIIPLAGQAGSNLANVNRWRGQVELPPITEQELDAATQRVTIGGEPGVMFELAGTDPRRHQPTRMLAAILRRGGTAWFIKMVGTDALVAKQKETFTRFLAGLKFAPADGDAERAAPPARTNQPPPIAKAPEHPAWRVPEGWRSEKPGSMQSAVWTVNGAEGTATVSASVLAGDGGGLLANVVRWRRQLGLPPIGAEELPQCTAPLAGAGKGVTLVTLASADGARKMLGAIVPAGAHTWFYKMVGDAAVVEAEREAFVNFVKSAAHGR